MKKLLSLLLTLALIFSLAACGGGDDDKTPSNDDKTPSSSQQQEQNTPDPVEDEPDDTPAPDEGSEETPDPDTSGSTAVLHELYDIEQLAGIPEFPDFAKKAIGDLRWCDDLGGDSFGKYHFNAYMKEVTQEDFETYIANLAANEPNDPIEGEEFYYYWDWGQSTGTYFPDSGTLDVVLTAK